MKYLVIGLTLLLLSGCLSLSTQMGLTGYVVGQNIKSYTSNTLEEKSSYENFEFFEEK